MIHSCKRSDNDVIKDVDGNVYNSVTIGTQIWMKENLKTTKYNDGNPVPLVTDNMTWMGMTTPAYCYNSNYEALYNWYTVNTGKLCPAGWHVPSDEEWTVLCTYLGGEAYAGGKLKETGTSHWTSPNTGATNETGFTAIPGGYRYYGGSFDFINDYGYWWTSSGTVTYAFVVEMQYFNPSVLRVAYDNRYGLSVRCLKD